MRLAEFESAQIRWKLISLPLTYSHFHGLSEAKLSCVPNKDVIEF